MNEALQELLDARAMEQLMIRYIDRIDANDPLPGNVANQSCSGFTDCSLNSGRFELSSASH